MNKLQHCKIKGRLDANDNEKKTFINDTGLDKVTKYQTIDVKSLCSILITPVSQQDECKHRPRFALYCVYKRNQNIVSCVSIISCHCVPTDEGNFNYPL